MARISFPDPITMAGEQRRVYESIVSGPRSRLVGPLRAALHSPALAERWQSLGALLRFNTTICPRLSELAILVTARRWNSQVEWYIHAAAARAAGLDETVIAAIKLAQPPAFGDVGEAAVYEFSRQLQQNGNVDEAVYQQVLAVHGETGIVELGAILGYYAMVSMTLNVHQIPLPDEGVVPPLQSVELGVEGDLPALTSLPHAVLLDKVATP
ncbi:MAG: carboxymuconolactone decarboxylase [Rhodoferax sp.]|nr:carboxymuconolactone decarboxylase [Rhodoferax sp.]